MITRIIRILSLCLLLLGAGTARGWAQTDPDDYNPTNPSEPMVEDYCKVVVEANPAEGAYVSGSGRYRMGGDNSQVYISTSARSTEDWTYTFKYWTLDNVQISTNPSFYYPLQKGELHFIAHYEKKAVIYDPTNPAEPSGQGAKRRFRLYLDPTLEGACSFNIASGEKQIEGTNLYLCVYPNAYYRFEGWRIDNEIVSTNTNFYFTMPDHDVHIEAVISVIPYDPENPAEPSGGSLPGKERQIINLRFGIPGIATDMTRVVFNNQKTLGYDIDCDAAKFLSESSQYQIYSIGHDDVKYQINERPVDNGRVAIGIQVKEAGTVQINADRLDYIGATLKDNLLGLEHPLASGPYIFDTEIGIFHDRFELVVPAVISPLDSNGDGKFTIVDVALLVSRLGVSATQADVQTATKKVLGIPE